MQLTIVADNVGSFAFSDFPTYCHFRLKRFDPQIWLPSLMLCWGLVTIFQGLVVNQAGLFGIRFREHVISFLYAIFFFLKFVNFSPWRF